MPLTSFPISTTTNAARPMQSAYVPGTTLLCNNPDGTDGQIPATLLPNAPLYLNVMSFGAVGNGVADDTSAISSCFSSAPAGSIIVFPPGKTFAMTGYVTMGADRITVIGTGSKIISKGAFQDRKFYASGKTGITFKDLSIDGGGFTTLAASTAFDTYTPGNQPGTIHMVDCVMCKVLDCDIKGVNWPVTLLGACENIEVKDCSFSGYFAAVYSYFSGSTGPAPRRVTIAFNDFTDGLYPTIASTSCAIARPITVTDMSCSGAIKFRGTPLDEARYYQYGHTIIGNKIRRAGQMGIELQGVNDCSVTSNTIIGTSLGISLSFNNRASVEANTIRECIYTCIEVDGKYGGVFDDPTTDVISLTGNILGGIDACGRSVDWVNNYGIVVSNFSTNVSITGGSIKYSKTAIAVTSLSKGVTITGVNITTNEQSDYGGIAGFDTSQGILVHNASNVEITGCRLQPLSSNWQRMVNIQVSSYVRVSGCSITSNNCPVYIQDSSHVSVENNPYIAMGSSPTPGTAGTSFVAVDSTESACSVIRIRGNTFVGATTYGINLYSPANSISDVIVERNDTSLASCGAANFLTNSVSGSGAVSGVRIDSNRGSGDASAQTNLGVPVYLQTGTITDRPEFETIIAQFTATFNLQSAVNCNGKRKRIICVSQFSTVTIHPASGETINGSTSNVLLTSQWAQIDLVSDGANWVALYSPRVWSKLFTTNFGTLSATTETFVNLTVDCPDTGSRPIAHVGWVDNLPVGVMVKQCFVSGFNQVTLTLYNTTGSSQTIGSKDYRISIDQF